MKPQRRQRKIAMSEVELDAFLGEERVCRVATIGHDGPHATPLWFMWHGGSVWLHSLSRSQRWTDWERDPRVALVIDAGDGYQELRGVEILGRALTVGEVPRLGEANDELHVIEQLFGQKYHGVGGVVYDGRHAWRRVTPEKITSWDFRKLATLE